MASPDAVQPSQPLAPFLDGFAARLLLAPGPIDSPMLTVRQVAVQLGVCRQTVYDLCAAGALVHVRVGNAIRIPVQALASLSRRSAR